MKVTFWLTALMLLLPARLPAEDFSKYGPCAADMEKFCSQVEPGYGRRRSCLMAHESELSKGCQDAQGLASAMLSVTDMLILPFKEPCRSDIESACSDIGIEGFHLLRCLSDQGNNLSPSCKKAFETYAKLQQNMTLGGMPCQLVGSQVDGKSQLNTRPSTSSLFIKAEDETTCTQECEDIIDFLGRTIPMDYRADYECLFKDSILLKRTIYGQQ